MKSGRKLLSLLLALAMVLGALPLPARAEEDGPACVCEALCTEEAKNTDCPVCGGEDADLTKCAKYEAPVEKPTEPATEPPTEKPTEPATEPPTEKPTEPATEPPTEKPTEPATEPATEETTEPATEPPTEPPKKGPGKAPQKRSPLETVQAMIDALPGKDEITADNAQSVKDQLSAIDGAKAALTDEEIEQLDPTRYMEAVAALEALKNQEENGPRVTAIEGTYLEKSWNGSAVISEGKPIPEDAIEINNDYFTSGGSKTLTSGTYCVTGDSVATGGRITISGEVHLILMDGCKLEAQSGINVSAGNKLFLYAQSKGEQMGQLNATGAENPTGAAIGGGNWQSCGDITIHGGAVNAKSMDGFSAGIGDGNSTTQMSGTITIYDGNVTAESGARAAGIGGNSKTGGAVNIYGGYVTARGGLYASYDIGAGVNSSDKGSFSLKGNAVIIANRISDDTNQKEWNGIIFKGNEGTVYGDVTLTSDFTILSGQSLTIPEGSTMTVNGTLTLNGTITDNGKLINNGAIIGNGTIQGDCELTGGGTIADTITINLPAPPMITTQPQKQSVSYGSTATFTAAASGRPEPTTYQWQVKKEADGDWEDIPGATEASYTTPAAELSMNGWKYRCVVTNSKGSAQSNEAALTVSPRKLDTPQNLRWEGTTAKWDPVEHASGYEVRLLRINQPGDLVNVDETEYDFPLVSRGAAEYSFEVRAIGTGNYSNSQPVTCGSLQYVYSVTFEANGGTPIPEVQNVLSGDGAQEPAAPDKAGYTLTGWYKDAACQEQWDFARDSVTANTTLYAGWEPAEYTITLVTNGGTVRDWNDFEYTYGTAVTLPAGEQITRTGYTFSGWYDNKDLRGSPVTEIPAGSMGDQTYYAGWTANRYTLTFKDGDRVLATITQDYDTPVTPPANPTREGYTFRSWSPAVPKRMPAGDAGFTAQWTVNRYTLTIDPRGGGAVTRYVLDYNADVPEIRDPTRVGHTFKGWDKAIPAKMPSHDVTISAQWEINKYTVTYKADGKVIDTQQVEYGKNAVPPKVPAKDGYRGKWDKDGKNITADTVITARYTRTFSGWWNNPKTGDSIRIVFAACVVSLVGLCGLGGYGLWKKWKKRKK